jgi:excisionase family DNA binding protein
MRIAWFAIRDLLEHISMSETPDLLTTARRLALRPREAAKALGISERLLWQLTQDGIIPCVRVGGGGRRTALYSVANLEAWLTQQTDALKHDDAR